MEPTAQSPHVVESVPGLDELSDEVTVRVFARAPFESHRVITAVCRRLRSLLSSPAFREARLESGYAEHGVVVAGGVFADGRTTDECWLLSISSGRWSHIAPLSGARRLACSAILENQDDNGQPEMWALGGWCDGNDLATVEVWNPRTNVWRESAPLSRTRSSAVAGVVGGCCLVVAGGFADDHCMRPAEVVVPIGSGPVPPLPYATSSAASCVLRGRLYVMGGWENTKVPGRVRHLYLAFRESVLRVSRFSDSEVPSLSSLALSLSRSLSRALSLSLSLLAAAGAAKVRRGRLYVDARVGPAGRALGCGDRRARRATLAYRRHRRLLSERLGRHLRRRR